MRRIVAVILAALLLLLLGCAPKSAEVEEPAAAESVQETDSAKEDAAEAAAEEPQPSGTLAVSQEEYLSARYLEEVPEGATCISADDRGEYILLESKKNLKNLWLSRVEYDAAQKDYYRTEQVWWMTEWEAGTQLVLKMALTKDYPAMELSWEDEFGQRERRLIEFRRLFDGTGATETVSLLYYVAPLTPTDLTSAGEYYYDINADGNKEVLRFTQPEQTADAQRTASLKITAGQTVYEYHLLLADSCRCFLADLDGDYQAELYCSGETAQAQPVCYVLHLTQTGIESMLLSGENAVQDASGNAVLSGQIEKLEQSLLYLENPVTLFGEGYTAHLAYGYERGTLEALNGVAALDGGKSVTLKASVGLNLPDGTKKTLPAGTVLTPEQIDFSTYVKIRTSDGTEGTLSLSCAQDGSLLVDGATEAELF